MCFKTKNKLKIIKSGIEGNGILAVKKIKKNQTIYYFTGERITFDEAVRRANDRSDISSDFLYINADECIDLDILPKMANHSCNPNSYIKGEIQLIAMRDIQKGEEITFDYSTTMDYDHERIKKAGIAPWTCKCNCRSPNCRGIIDEFKTLPPETQEFYIKNKYLPDFIQNKFGKE